MAVEPNLSHTAAMILQAIHTGRISGFVVMEVTGLPSGTVYPAMRGLERDDLITSRWGRQSIADAEHCVSTTNSPRMAERPSIRTVRRQLEINRADRRSDLGVVVPEGGDLRNVDLLVCTSRAGRWANPALVCGIRAISPEKRPRV